MDLEGQNMECPTCGKIMRLTEGKDGIKYYKCMYCGKLIKE